MWNNSDVIFILNGGSNGYGSRTSAQAVPLIKSVAQLFINILTSVCSDVYILRVKFS